MFLHEGSGHQVEMMLDPNQAPLNAFGRYFFWKNVYIDIYTYLYK